MLVALRVVDSPVVRSGAQTGETAHWLLFERQDGQRAMGCGVEELDVRPRRGLGIQEAEACPGDGPVSPVAGLGFTGDRQRFRAAPEGMLQMPGQAPVLSPASLVHLIERNTCGDRGPKCAKSRDRVSEWIWCWEAGEPQAITSNVEAQQFIDSAVASASCCQSAEPDIRTGLSGHSSWTDCCRYVGMYSSKSRHVDARVPKHLMGTE